MSRICWWLVDRLSRLLEPDERDAALGDFVESGLAAGDALRAILGLVARRQVSLWTDWRPWLALVGIVGPGSLILLNFSVFVSGSFELHLWIIENYPHFNPAMLEETGLTLRRAVAGLLCLSSLHFVWSWTAGFVLASLSRRTAWVNVALFGCLATVVFSAGYGAATSPKRPLALSLTALLIVLPLLWGIVQGWRLRNLRLRSAIPLALAVAAATIVSVWIAGYWRGGTLGATLLVPLAPWAVRVLLSLFLCWPAAYLVAMAARRLPNKTPGLA